MNLLAPQSNPMTGENNTFIIETIWDNMQSFISYTQSEAFKKSHENMPPREWFTGKPSVEVYESRFAIHKGTYWDMKLKKI